MRGGTSEIEWLAGLFPVRPPRGRPLVVMFTDIAGFTLAVARGGDAAGIALVAAHDAAALPAVRRHLGRVVKRLGDGLMVVFPEAADAVAAGLALQRAAARRARVRLRVGIHAGPTRWRAGDLVGHAVNVAARIAARTPPGTVLVSGEVRAAAATSARFRPRGPLAIAGVPRLPLYRAEPVARG